jgi:hypothetical protein
MAEASKLNAVRMQFLVEGTCCHGAAQNRFEHPELRPHHHAAHHLQLW